MRTSLNPLKNTRGVTVIIALGLAMVMLIFAFGVATIIKNTNQSIKTFKNASQAQIQAASMGEVLRLGDGSALVAGINCQDAITRAFPEVKATQAAANDSLEEVSDQVGSAAYPPVNQIFTAAPAGDIFNPNDQGPIGDTYIPNGGEPAGEFVNRANQANTQDVTFSCEVVGTTNAKVGTAPNDWYVVPTPGTGAAGKNCSVQSATDLDNSCSWGKLSFGTTASAQTTIPLYYGNPHDGGPLDCDSIKDVCSFADAKEGDANMVLKVRTPCETVDPADGSCTKHYEFDEGDGTNDKNQNSTVIYWQINADCTDPATGITETCSVMPANDATTEGIRDWPYTNSEIFESLLNDGGLGENKVWSTNFTASDTKGLFEEYRIKNDASLRIFQWLTSQGGVTVSKPSLQFLLVAPNMKSSDGKTIPNLEYQLLSKRPISTQETIYNVQVNYQGQSYKMMDKVQRKGGIFNFTIQN